MRTVRAASMLAILAILIGCSRRDTQAVYRPPGEHKLAFSSTITKTVDLKYHLYLPDGYGEEQGKSWPLVLFLHGAGERGDDLEMVKIHGLNKIRTGRPDMPFILLSPLCPENSWWTEQLDGVKALLDEIKDTYAVDERRVYLTGLSMGGQGSWHLATRHPESFAAVAPICGWGQPYLACQFKDLPVWAFHGAKDQVVPVSESERMVAAVQECGGDARLTVYPEAYHDSWTVTYTNPELYEWLLSHAR